VQGFVSGGLFAVPRVRGGSPLARSGRENGAPGGTERSLLRGLPPARASGRCSLSSSSPVGLTLPYITPTLAGSGPAAGAVRNLSLRTRPRRGAHRSRGTPVRCARPAGVPRALDPRRTAGLSGREAAAMCRTRPRLSAARARALFDLVSARLSSPVPGSPLAARRPVPGPKAPLETLERVVPSSTTRRWPRPPLAARRPLAGARGPADRGDPATAREGEGASSPRRWHARALQGARAPGRSGAPRPPSAPCRKSPKTLRWPRLARAFDASTPRRPGPDFSGRGLDSALRIRYHFQPERFLLPSKPVCFFFPFRKRIATFSPVGDRKPTTTPFHPVAP